MNEAGEFMVIRGLLTAQLAGAADSVDVVLHSGLDDNRRPTLSGYTVGGVAGTGSDLTRLS